MEERKKESLIEEDKGERELLRESLEEV